MCVCVYAEYRHDIHLVCTKIGAHNALAESDLKIYYIRWLTARCLCVPLNYSSVPDSNVAAIFSLLLFHPLNPPSAALSKLRLASSPCLL